mgnify:FL=1
MNYFEINHTGEAYIRTDSGTIIRKVGNGESVNHAEFNNDESLFIITYDSGRCEIRDRKNKLVETITSEGIKEAFFRKDGILLVLKDGTKIMKG